jgi:hypothetical protein
MRRFITLGGGTAAAGPFAAHTQQQAVPGVGFFAARSPERRRADEERTDMTSKYEFQSTLHRTSRDMHRHMATAYMSACGLNDAESVRDFFETFTDEMIADGAERKLWLSSHPDYDRAEFIEAMNSLRKAAKIVERWRWR